MSMSTKHDYGKIGDTLVTFVGKDVSEDRKNFLKEFLEYNNFELVIEEKVDDEGNKTFIMGVTDMVFNPVIWIYDRRLKTTDGRIANEDYWLQASSDLKPQYWER